VLLDSDSLRGALKNRRLRWTGNDEHRLPAYQSEPPVDLAPDQPKPIRGIEASDLNVVFQPIVEIATGRLFAQEALVRCKIPMFESPVALFERAVTEQACGRLGRAIREVAFARCPGVPLFVNVHPNELSARWLVRPDDPVFFHDSDVYLEITESAAFSHFELCFGVLKEVCSRAGAFLVVDDFGAGYSNLKRIIDLQPKVVKLDRTLIARLDRDRRQQTLVRYMVDLCVELGAKVVAEGIETLDELKACRDCGAQYGQGFLLARPAYPAPRVEWPL
jgi:EAL domain-containing protein (putative c-di-GMP-specific phosphodiesterase class I)